MQDPDAAARLRQAYDLYQSGALTESEFQAVKTRIQGKNVTAPTVVAKHPDLFRQAPSAAHSAQSKRSGWGLLFLFIPALVMVVLLVGIFWPSDPSPGSPGASNTSSGTLLPARISTTQSDTSGKPTEVVDLNGVISFPSGLATSTEFGRECTATDQYSFIAPGSPVRVQAEGQKYLGPYKITSGRGTGEGTCELTFSGSVHLSDKYQVIFEKDGSAIPPLMTTCDDEETWQGNGMVFIHVVVGTSGNPAKCVRPDYLDG